MKKTDSDDPDIKRSGSEIKGQNTRRRLVPSVPISRGIARQLRRPFSVRSNRRIQTERLRMVMAANSAMVILYWDIGRLILDRQEA